MPRKVYVIYLLFILNSVVNANIVFKTDTESLLFSPKVVDALATKEKVIPINKFTNFKEIPPLDDSHELKYGYVSIFFPDFVWYGVIQSNFYSWIKSKHDSTIGSSSINSNNKNETKSSFVDTDGDGIDDEIDLDDDNDGILDAVESPSCYYNVIEANKVVAINSTFNGAAGDPAAGENATLLYNNIHNDGAVATAYNFAASQILTPGRVIFNIEYPTSFVMSLMSVIQATNGMSNLGFGQVFGSNDGTTYTAISSGVRLNATAVNFPINTSDPYRYYQIRYIGTNAAGNNTNTALGVAPIHEIVSVVSGAVPYIDSAHPKPGPCTEDTDGDGTPNHLDSDGDGCFDSYEGGATTDASVSQIPGPYGENGFANSLETSVDSGIINYTSTYRQYAIFETLNFA